MIHYVPKSHLIWLACACLLLAGQPVLLWAKGIKTYYKQYSVFAFQNENYLCEPYTVQKNDWLYKIFRNKGEISKQDFPLFLSIFKKINPKLSNIDAISPGIRILIPLKKVTQQAFQPDEAGNVEVPVVEFSGVPENYDLTAHTRKYTIQSGDTVSNLLDKAFLKKGGGITREGKGSFRHLNPDIKDIHLVYPGTRVVIPEPSILSQPWFRMFLEHGSAYVSNGPAAGKQDPTKPATPPIKPPLKILPVIHDYQIQQLKRYASLIKGTLVNQGKLHFPGKNGLPDAALDLAQTPLIETGTPPGKIILIPKDRAGEILDKDLIQSIRSYWRHLKIEQIEAAIQSTRQLEKKVSPIPLKPAVLRQIISGLIAATPYEYLDNDTIRFFIGTLQMSAKLGRIKRPEKQDLLINYGNIYGMGLEAIEKMGFEVFSIPTNGMTFQAATQSLLERLGYTTWQNPAFTQRGMVETLEGIYAVRKQERIFISQSPISTSAEDFLKNEHISFHRL